MKKRVFIIHGWDGYPEEGWFPWLKKELASRGYEVIVPDMPDTKNPRIETWVSRLKELVERPDRETYFVGHSIGCQTILRYLEKLQPNEKIGGCVFVAPWFTLMNFEEGEEIIAKPWLETPIDFVKVRQHTNKFFAIFSDNDDVVPQDNVGMFAQRLNAKTIVEHEKGHFSGGDGIIELPVVLQLILDIAKNQ